MVTSNGGVGIEVARQLSLAKAIARAVDGYEPVVSAEIKPSVVFRKKWA